MKETTRKLTPAELSTLACRLGLDVLAVRIVRGSIIAFVIFGVSANILGIFFDGQSAQIQTVLLWVCLAVGVVSGISIERFIGRLPGKEAARREYDEGLARVLHLRVVAAIRVAEFEDGGDAFLLKLDDDRVFFLEGQYLHEPVERREFPSTEIEVALSLHSGVVVSVNCLGEYLAPLGRPLKLPTATEDELYSGTFVDVQFEKLVASAS